MGKRKWLDRQRRRLGDDRDEHARTDARPACAPEATGSAGNILAAVQHLHQCAVQVDVAAGVFIGGQQCSPTIT